MRRRTTSVCSFCKRPRGGKATVPVMGGWMHEACREGHSQWLEEWTQKAIREGRYRPEPIRPDPTPTAARELDIGTYGGGR